MTLGIYIRRGLRSPRLAAGRLAVAALVASLVASLGGAPLSAQAAPDSRSRTLATPAPRPIRPLHDLADAGESFLRDTWAVVSFPSRLEGNDWAVLGGVMATGALLYAWDGPISESLMDGEPGTLHQGLRDVGNAIEPIGLMGNTNKYWAAAALLGYFTRQEWLRQPARDLLYSHYIAGLTRNPVRALVGRRRPDDDAGPREFEPGDGTSFPSGHASTAVQVATVLAHHVDDPWIDALLYGLAATVVFQRVDSGKHWASDSWIGAAWGWGVARVVVTRRTSVDDRVAWTLVPGPAGPYLIATVPLG